MPDRIPFYSDAAWWGEQAVAWIVFTALVTLAINRLQYWLDARTQEPYKNWHLAVWGDDPPDAADDKLQELHWEEVRRMEQSAFERWKTVKSVISGYCRIKLARIEKAEDVWCKFDRPSRRFIIDLNRIPESQRGPFEGNGPKYDSPAWGPHGAGELRARTGTTNPGDGGDVR